MRLLDEGWDHLAMRTADMSCLICRELLQPPGKRYDQVETARNLYAKDQGLPSCTGKLDWKDYRTLAQ